MEKKVRRKTDGMPLYLGIAGAALMVIAAILQSGPTQAYTASVYAKLGATYHPMTVYATSIGGLLVDPGVFLVLLLVGAGKPRRGSAFAVVWIVISGLSVVSGLYSLFASSQQVQDIKNLSAAMVPGGYYLYASLGLLGSLCILACCIVFLKRLHTPPRPEDLPPAA